MSLIMLRRLIIIINGSWNLSNQDFMQIKYSFEFIHPTLSKANVSAQIKWQMMLILVVLKSKEGRLVKSDFLLELTNTKVESVFKVC